MRELLDGLSAIIGPILSVELSFGSALAQHPTLTDQSNAYYLAFSGGGPFWSL